MTQTGSREAHTFLTSLVMFFEREVIRTRYLSGERYTVKYTIALGFMKTNKWWNPASIAGENLQLVSDRCQCWDTRFLPATQEYDGRIFLAEPAEQVTDSIGLKWLRYVLYYHRITLWVNIVLLNR